MEHQVIKLFNELSVDELYQILKLRSEVFVLEQNCVYLDMDNKDQKSYHLLIYSDKQLAAYTRLLPAGVSFQEVSIGRVVTSPKFRGIGLGKRLMEKSIETCHKLFGNADIRIGAQLYLLTFYESLGFEKTGEPYYEDGIPHIEMLRKAEVTAQ